MELREFVELSPLSTMKIGGMARYLVEVRSLSFLKEALVFAGQKNLPVAILGGGSNTLISDDGFPGIVLRITVPGIEWEKNGDSVYATVGAGVSWDDLVRSAVEKGYHGVENLYRSVHHISPLHLQNYFQPRPTCK